MAVRLPGHGVTVVGGPRPGRRDGRAGRRAVHVDADLATTSIHAFYVPRFLFKRDAIPGRPNEFEFTVDEPGTYGGQCAEFCGVYHDRMLFTVRAVTRAEYEAWLRRSGSRARPPRPVASPAPLSPIGSP